MDHQLSDYLWSLVIRAPVILIALVGIIWALVSWSKAPTSSLLTLLSFGLILVASFIGPALFSWLVPLMARNAPPGEEHAAFMFANRTVLGSWNLCTAISLGALIFAVFAGRAVHSRREEGLRLHRRDDYDDRDPAPPSRTDTGDDRFKAP